MNRKLDIAGVNIHVLGDVTKTLIGRGLATARNQRFKVLFEAKAGDSGKLDDVVSELDTQLQQLYVRWWRERLPGWGVVGEEQGLFIKAESGNPWWVIDPIDGTKALELQQSHGIATQGAVVHNGRLVTATIGDVNSGEIYHFRAGSNKVHRLRPDGTSVLLGAPTRTMADGALLLRDIPGEHDYSALALRLIERGSRPFKKLKVDDGSFALSMMRLAKGEVQALLMPRRKQKPWDILPPQAIVEQLGYRFFLVGQRSLKPIRLPVTLKPYDLPGEVLVVHSTHIPELRAWLRK